MKGYTKQRPGNLAFEMKPMHLDIKDGYHWNHPNDFN
jgi:hypothetical protein